MPEAIRAALARQSTFTPTQARLASAMTQAQWADWWGVSRSTVVRAEDEDDWNRYRGASGRTIALWLALFGPDPDAAFRAVGRWSMTHDIQNAADAIFIRATVGPDKIEQAIREVLGRDKREAS